MYTARPWPSAQSLPGFRSRTSYSRNGSNHQAKGSGPNTDTMCRAADQRLLPNIDRRSLTFYAEVYGTDAWFGNDSLFLLSYQIEDFEKKTVFGPYKRSVRAKGKAVEPVMAEFDIAQLPSGITCWRSKCGTERMS